ncbi:MAG: hypothetical protein ACRCTZ_17015 [Sarcina sp.]
MEAEVIARYGFKEIRKFGVKTYVIDNVNDSWYFEYVEDSVIRLMHESHYNQKAGMFHLQREFTKMCESNIGIVYEYIRVHSTKVYNARYKKSQKTRMDYLFDKIK